MVLTCSAFSHTVHVFPWEGSEDFSANSPNLSRWKLSHGSPPIQVSQNYRQTNGYASFFSTSAVGEANGMIFWKEPLPSDVSWRVRILARFDPSSFRVSESGWVEGLVGVLPNVNIPRSKFVMNLAANNSSLYSVPNWGVNSRQVGATDGELRVEHGLAEVILFLDYDAGQKTITGSYADPANPDWIIPAKTLSTANWQGANQFVLGIGGYASGATIASGVLQMDDLTVRAIRRPSFQDMVPVLDPFNPGNPDNSGAGGVNYNFAISRTEITVRQYCRFLNSVAKRSNPVTVALYSNTFRQFSGLQTVERLGNHPNFSYVPAAGQDFLPVEVPWLDAARYCNWMHQGARANADLENGAYPLRGSLSGWTGIRRNPSARFYVPSADEWYKAGYYDPNKNGSGAGGYWATAYRSDVYSINSSNEIVLEPNRANFNTGAGWLPVGSYPDFPSHYGTYDQVGNSWEWISDRYLYDQQGLMGGNWTTAAQAGGSDSYGPGDGATGWFYAESDPNFRATFRLATRLPFQGTNRCPGARGRAFSFRVTPGPEFSDATFLAFSATNLPAGLSINASSGVISGTPAAAGVFSNTLVRIAISGGDEAYAVNVPLVFDIQATVPPGFALQAGQLALANRNLPEAVREFNNAVTAQANNATNRVYRALSTLALLQQNAAGNAILDKFHVLPGPTPWDAFGDVDNRKYRLSPQAYRTNTFVFTNWDNSRTTNRYVYYEPKNRGVSTTEIINLLRNVHLPVEQTAEADLATITNTNFVVTIPRGLVGSTAVTLDYGDIQMLRALLAAKRALAYFVNIHNWAMTINNWQTIVNRNGRDERVTVENILLTLPNLLRLNRAADGPACRAELKKAADHYFVASDFIRSTREPGVSRLFNLELVDYAAEQLFRDRIAAEWRPALDGPTTLYSGNTDNTNNSITVNGDAFFRASGLDLRSKMPQVVTNRVRQGTFPDATIGGMFPTLTRGQMEDWLWGWTPKENEWYYEEFGGWQSLPTGLSVGPYVYGLLRLAPGVSTNTLVVQSDVEATNLRIVVTNAVPQMVFSCNNLPGWASLNPLTGFITGTPALEDVTTNRPISIRLEAPPLGNGTNLFVTNRTLSLRVLPPRPTFSSTNSLVFTQGVAARFTNTVTPGSLPGYPVTFASTSLPTGLSVSTNGIISGIPTLAGNFKSILSASNAGGLTNFEMNLVIRPSGGFRLNDTDFIGRTGDDIRYQVNFGPGFSNFVCANLPAGLSISPTGLITGRPLEESLFTEITVGSRRNGVFQTNQVPFQIANSLPILASPTNATATRNQPFRYQIVAGGFGREWAGYDSFEGTVATNWRVGVSQNASLVRSNGNLILNFAGTATNATNRFAYLEWARNLPGSSREWIAYGTAIVPSSLVTATNRYAEALIQAVRNDGTLNFAVSSFAGQENSAVFCGGSYLSLDTFRALPAISYGFDSWDGNKSRMVLINGAMEFRSTNGSSQGVAVADTRFATLPTDRHWSLRAELEMTNITWTNASAIGLALVKDRLNQGWFEMTATNGFSFATFSLRNNTSSTNGVHSLVLAGTTNTTTNRSVLRLELAYDAVSMDLISVIYAGTNNVSLAASTNSLTNLISDVNPFAGDRLRLAMYGSTTRTNGNPAGTMRIRSLAIQTETINADDQAFSPIFLRSLGGTLTDIVAPNELQTGRTFYGTNNLPWIFTDEGKFYSWNLPLTNALRIRLGGDTLLGGATNGRGTNAIGWQDFGVVPLYEVLFSASNLPAGLALDTEAVPGLIYGTPTAAGTNQVTVVMTTSGGSRTNTIRIVVAP